MTLIDLTGLRKKLGHNYSPQHIRRLIKAGIVPPPVKMGLGKSGKNTWVEDEVDAHIAAKIKQQNETLKVSPRGGGPDDKTIRRAPRVANRSAEFARSERHPSRRAATVRHCQFAKLARRRSARRLLFKMTKKPSTEKSDWAKSFSQNLKSLRRKLEPPPKGQARMK